MLRNFGNILEFVAIAHRPCHAITTDQHFQIYVHDLSQVNFKLNVNNRFLIYLNILLLVKCIFHNFSVRILWLKQNRGDINNNELIYSFEFVNVFIQ